MKIVYLLICNTCGYRRYNYDSSLSICFGLDHIKEHDDHTLKYFKVRTTMQWYLIDVIFEMIHVKSKNENCVGYLKEKTNV